MGREMGNITRHHLVVASALVGLTLADLLTDFALIWMVEERWFRYEWMNQVGYGLLFAPVMLLGLWFGLGDGRWYLRLNVAIGLTMCVAIAFGLVHELSPMLRRQSDAN